MKTLRSRVQSAVNEVANNQQSWKLDPYSPDADGETYYSYSGLVDGVIDTIYNEGNEDTITNREISDIVFETF